jgi:hypothetical protein
MRNEISKFRLFLCLVFMAALLISCDKEDETEGNTSHNAGKNCMSCHTVGFSHGAFTVAGTVYNSSKSSIYGNATVKLTTGANGTGTVKMSVTGDASGNFHTTSGITLTGGLYVAVTGRTGNAQYMAAPVTTGQCNGCHNNTTGKIWVN